MPLSVALKVLDLPEGRDSSTPAAAKQRYRELAVALHPDKNPHARAVEAFGALTRALAVALAQQQEQRGADGFDPQQAVDDDEIFWMDPSGTIRVPAAAKEVGAQRAAGDDPRWAQALALMSKPGAPVASSATRTVSSALPLPASMLGRLRLPPSGRRTAPWPREDHGGMATAAPYMLLFVRRAAGAVASGWRLVSPGQVEASLARHLQLSAAAAPSRPSGPAAEREEEPPLHAVVLLPCWMAVQGAFPLNGTYFQTNEVFLDAQTLQRPTEVPWELLLALRRPAFPRPAAAAASEAAVAVASSLPLSEGGSDAASQSPNGSVGPTTPRAAACDLAWKTVYFGVSASSICRGMGFAEVAHTFHRSTICIRTIDCRTGEPEALPGWLSPNGK